VCLPRGAGAAGYREKYWTAVGRSDRLFCYCMETENFEDAEKRVVSGCSVRMHSGWVIATGHKARNLAHVQ